MHLATSKTRLQSRHWEQLKDGVELWLQDGESLISGKRAAEVSDTALREELQQV